MKQVSVLRTSAWPGWGPLIGDFMTKALVITTAEINCDRELAEAFELAGATPVSIHLNRLMKDPSILDEFDLVVIDEVGQLSQWIFERLMRLWRHADRRPAFVFAGDFCQLRGVDPTRACDSDMHPSRSMRARARSGCTR